jgi:XTP/dITP diphosphohydrolase
LSAEGECLGEIATTPRGESGFGYDPVFFVKCAGATMAELPMEEKNALSHRGKALREFSRLLGERE